MILVDSSVWIDHFRHARSSLSPLLLGGRVLCHDAVIGELACGQLRARRETLALLSRLPRVVQASTDEALALVEKHHLFASGIGWTDVHLLAAARLSGCTLWTLERKLQHAAHRLGVAHPT